MARSQFQLCAPWTFALIFYSTSTPIQGVGHDYIHMLSETVKPPRTKELCQRFYAHPGCEIWLRRRCGRVQVSSSINVSQPNRPAHAIC